MGLMRDGVPPLTIGVTDWTGSWHPPATIPHGRLQHGNLVLHHLFAMLMRICINQPYTHTHSTYIYNYIYIININTCFFFAKSEYMKLAMTGWRDGNGNT